MKKWDIMIEHIRTESMLGDPQTKCLKPIVFKEHVVNWVSLSLLILWFSRLLSIITWCKHWSLLLCDLKNKNLL